MIERSPRSTIWARPSPGPSPAQLQQLGDQASRPRGSVGPHRAVVDRASDLLGDRGGDLLRAIGAEVHRPPRAVAVEAVADVEVLLEVVTEREVEEGPAVCGQLHGRCEPALDDREVAGGEMAVELVHV